METKCHENVVFFEVQLKAKCYRILCLRLARLGGKPTVDVSQMPPRCVPDASEMFPPYPGGVEDSLDPGWEPKNIF